MQCIEFIFIVFPYIHFQAQTHSIFKLNFSSISIRFNGCTGTLYVNSFNVHRHFWIYASFFWVLHRRIWSWREWDLHFIRLFSDFQMKINNNNFCTEFYVVIANTEHSEFRFSENFLGVCTGTQYTGTQYKNHNAECTFNYPVIPRVQCILNVESNGKTENKRFCIESFCGKKEKRERERKTEEDTRIEGKHNNTIEIPFRLSNSNRGSFILNAIKSSLFLLHSLNK